eukprot:m.26774 g.26774  ORF g.26774 m.26774 type:complete len:513 (-) comp4346_c0_seq1:57-1595(-)
MHAARLCMRNRTSSASNHCTCPLCSFPVQRACNQCNAFEYLCVRACALSCCLSPHANTSWLPLSHIYTGLCAIELNSAEHRLLQAGLDHWRTGVVGAHADATITTFDVPVGRGFMGPSCTSPTGVAPIDQALHIHTARCEPQPSSASSSQTTRSVRAEDSQGAADTGTAAVQTRSWETDREALTATVEGSAPVVLMHGYGSGIGIFSAMLPGLAAALKAPVFAIDSLGCGLSSRPRAPDGHWTDLTVRQSEDFFVLGIERWRQAMGFKKIRLVGHSIGGYLALTYAERHPENVEQVITVGCAGIPSLPEGLEERIKARYPVLGRLVVGMWSGGVSPFNIMRYGPGDTFFTMYAGRWRALPWLSETAYLKDYLHANWTGDEASAGGYAHYTLLYYASYAREPLWDRIPNLTLSKPLRMVYGESDWMNPNHALDLRDALLQKVAADANIIKLPPSIEVAQVRHGGHNIVLENPTGTVEAIVAALEGSSTVDGRLYTGLWPPHMAEETAQRTASL